MRDFLSEEKGLCAEVESLCMTDPTPRTRLSTA